jgi:hypothetical protein
MHSIKIARECEIEFAAEFAAFSADIHDVFEQNRIVGLNARQSVFAIGAR